MNNELQKRVSALIYFRALIVTILLGSFYFFQIQYNELLYLNSFSYLIASLYFLTIIYALILRRLKKREQLRYFAHVQIGLDIVAETLLIYISGGVGSIFSFMFPLSILSAGIVLNRRACYIFATLSSLLYGGLLDLQFYNIIQSSSTIIPSDKEFFYNIFAHITAFYLIAFLSG